MTVAVAEKLTADTFISLFSTFCFEEQTFPSL